MKILVFIFTLIFSSSNITAQGCVQVYFFGKNISDYTIYNQKNIVNLTEASVKHFDEKLRTFVYVPGLAKPLGDEEVQTVITSLLPLWSKSNIVFLDWSSCPTDYVGAMAMFKEANKVLNELLKAGLDTSRTHVIGFGMGSFIAGYVAKFYKNATVPLGRLTGLNPHNLMNAPFLAPYEIKRSDALFVDIIHVDEIFGSPTTNGHVDFWPNGGKDQLGCFGAALCDHFRAWKYFSESIARKPSNLKFLSAKCPPNGTNFNNNNCNGSEKASMGFYADVTTSNRDPNVTVNYFVSTNSQSPFSI